jgi:hypothetical protein
MCQTVLHSGLTHLRTIPRTPSLSPSGDAIFCVGRRGAGCSCQQQAAAEGPDTESTGERAGVDGVRPRWTICVIRCRLHSRRAAVPRATLSHGRLALHIQILVPQECAPCHGDVSNVAGCSSQREQSCYQDLSLSVCVALSDSISSAPSHCLRALGW